MEKKDPRMRENLFVINEEGRYVVFDPEEGDQWKLNETGALIVDCLMQGASMEDIKSKIMEEYDIDSEKAEESLNKYIEVLKKEGIILED
ncbi:MAG: HPr-rel-A system PqqD family peptide chaperone [Theionarchaea archaeon]|nr:HPr-rel-A system PqqD family peptide chaperone [Theionarchaea archaeon]MBU7036354.1 HPr-rel-A system PqqD family peptide chaperone [Theionarchaea archaeon]